MTIGHVLGTPDLAVVGIAAHQETAAGAGRGPQGHEGEVMGGIVEKWTPRFAGDTEVNQLEGRVRGLEQQLAEARAENERLRRMRVNVVCSYCGEIICTDAEWSDKVPVHMANCAKNPVNVLLLENEQLSAPSFWVVERFEDGTARSLGYWTGHNSRDFTPNVVDAVQFVRKEDAQVMVAPWHWRDCDITDHKMIAARAAGGK